MEIVTSFRLRPAVAGLPPSREAPADKTARQVNRVNPESFRGRRLYFARLSNQDVIFLCVCSVQSLKGLFQAKAIRAAIITMSTNTRFMSEIARNAG